MRESRSGGAYGYTEFAAMPLTSGQLVQGSGNGDLAASGFTVIGAGGSAGTGPTNQGTATTLARSDHDHTTIAAMTWFVANPQVLLFAETVTIPDTVTNIAILGFRVTANTTSGNSSSFNIDHCTASCNASTPTTRLLSAWRRRTSTRTESRTWP